MVGKQIIYQPAEFRSIAASLIQKGSSLLSWQIENGSEEFLGGLLKIGHAFYPTGGGFQRAQQRYQLRLGRRPELTGDSHRAE